MWVGHYAAGLIAKPFAPRVPLSLLCLASAILDATFFVLNLIGIESFAVNDEFSKRGCFPYATNYPYTHSLLGMVVIGIALAGAYNATTTRVKVPLQDLAVIVAVAASHFLLELPAHREDVKITPNDNVALGAGLFDKPATLFALETGLFFAGLWVYTALAPLATRSGYKNNINILRAVVVFMVVQQAHFCFGAAPTYETRFIHAPTFLFEILLSCWALGKLEG
ncbi:hypothetical protein HWV62_18744 [Athelia sp. TMB]|nr:hypothetical protein HWV62_18744 [Athelia sp. TMB]